jgi:hypothetical protein
MPMKFPLAVVLAVMILGAAGCALLPPHPDRFSFAATGDAPYNDREEREFIAMIAQMGREPLAFVVHVGDLKAGSNSPCTDDLFHKRREQLQASAHPLVLTPGDNDWTDCRRATNGKMDPIERLAKMRQVFFADAFSLGRTRMPLAVQDGCALRDDTKCQCPGIPENRMWTHRGVVFVTLHAVGSNDNHGFDAANDEESRCRQAANRQWLERAFRIAGGGGMRGLAIFTQANPWVASKEKVYDRLLAQLREGASTLARPVLFVHGDTHTYRVDQPFRDPSGKVVANLTRLEVFGSPRVGWVRVSVDPNDASLWRIEPVPPMGSNGG